MQATNNGWNSSSRRHPCPICGRDRDGDCRLKADGSQALCHYGNSFTPPTGLKPGDVIDGQDGQRWAFTGDSADGRAAHFTPDKEREATPRRAVSVGPARKAAAPSAPVLARLPEPGKEPPPHLKEGTVLAYSVADGKATQWTVEKGTGKNKRPIPHHVNAAGTVEAKAGPDPWPLWKEEEALQHGAGKWITEAEGPKCAAWLRAGGLVSVSQPGHAHSTAAIEARYRRLKEAGVLGIAYLADHDKTGKEKAERCAAAAAAAGLGFRVIHAADLWPAIPAGGSIDDAPGTAAERCDAFAAALQKPEPEPGKVVALDKAKEAKERLRDAIADGTDGADLVSLIAEVSDDSGLHPMTVKQIAEALQREQEQAVDVRQEAQALAAEADRKAVGEVLSTAYLLPARIAAALEAVTRYLPGDGPSRTLPYLAAVAGLMKLGTQVEAVRAAGFVVPVNLYGCLVADSGGKKSPTHKRSAMEPLAALRDELARQNQREREAWQQECDDLKKGQPRPPEPIGKRLVVGDFTGEALAQQLEVQEAAGLGLLIYRDELSGLFAGLNAYKGGKGNDEQQLLELFDGGGLTSLRVSGHRTYSRSQVSIWGGTQKATLRKMVADGDDSGLWARFLFCPLPERVVSLQLDRSDEEQAEIEAAEQTLADAAAAIYRMPPRTYRLSRDAAAAFVRYEENRQRAAYGATISAEKAVYGKSAGKVLRVAGVLHLLRIATDEAAAADEIGPDLIERATAFVDHLDAWVVSLHASVAAGGVGTLMRTIHRVAEAVGQPVRWKEVAVRLSKAQRKGADAAAAAEAMRALAQGGWGEIEDGKRAGRGLAYRATKPLP